VLSGSAGVGKTRVARDAVAGCGPRNARRHWIIGTASARSVPLGAFADIASDFGPDPLRRVREVIDGLIGATRDGEVIVGVDDAHLLDDLSAFTVHQLVTRRLATVILTIRSGEQPPDAITAIWKDHHLPNLELQPLSLPKSRIWSSKSSADRCIRCAHDGCGSTPKAMRCIFVTCSKTR